MDQPMYGHCRPRLMNSIRFYRKLAKLTQVELADQVGVSKNAISSFERNEYCPLAEVALKICTVLNQPFEKVFYLSAISCKEVQHEEV